ncbi:MAG: ABC transporter permease [Solirubrobacterales bacterium]
MTPAEPNPSLDLDTAISAEAIQAALVAGDRPEPAGRLSACFSFAWRAILKIKHVPEQLVDVTITPVLFLVMFVYIFGGAVAGSTDEYLQYLLPGILVQTILFTTVYSGVTLNTDLTKGVIDRIRSLPIWGPAPLLGASFGDIVRYILAGTLVTIFGIVLGFNATNGVGGIVAGMALVILFAFGLSWVFTTLGLLFRSPSAVMNTGFMVLFPLIFLSNIFVEPSSLPSILESFVNINPVSSLVTAVRGLMAGDVDTSDIALVIAEAAALSIIFIPLTTHLYRTRT